MTGMFGGTKTYLLQLVGVRFGQIDVLVGVGGQIKQAAALCAKLVSKKSGSVCTHTSQSSLTAIGPVLVNGGGAAVGKVGALPAVHVNVTDQDLGLGSVGGVNEER